MNTPDQAIAFAKSQPSPKKYSQYKSWAGYCLHFVRVAYKGKKRFPWALLAWEGSKKKHLANGTIKGKKEPFTTMKDWSKVPRGAIVWWGPTAKTSKYGHVAIHDGKGFCWTTDYKDTANDKGRGYINYVSIDEITKKRGGGFLGWTEDLGGEMIPELVVTKAPVAPAPVPAPVVEIKPVDVVAQEVIAGAWGNAAERQKRLKAAGYDYAAVQQRVNAIVAGGKTASKPAEPVEKAVETSLIIESHNIKHLEKTGKWSKTSRGTTIGKRVYKHKANVFQAQEAADKPLRAKITAALPGRQEHYVGTAKAFWTGESVKVLDKGTVASDHTYKGLVRRQGYLVGERNGVRFATLSIHTDYRKPANQQAQAVRAVENFLKIVRQYGVPLTNVLIAGDFNDNGAHADVNLTKQGFVKLTPDPKHALDHAWVHKSNKTAKLSRGSDSSSDHPWLLIKMTIKK